MPWWRERDVTRAPIVIGEDLVSYEVSTDGLPSMAIAKKFPHVDEGSHRMVSFCPGAVNSLGLPYLDIAFLHVQHGVTSPLFTRDLYLAAGFCDSVVPTKEGMTISGWVRLESRHGEESLIMLVYAELVRQALVHGYAAFCNAVRVATKSSAFLGPHSPVDLDEAQIKRRIYEEWWGLHD